MVVRLGWILVLDNAIHIIWLRYAYPKGPYTTLLNNSELFTLLLALQMVLFHRARHQTHRDLRDPCNRDALDDIEKAVVIDTRWCTGAGWPYVTRNKEGNEPNTEESQD
jgi:hypothetical protein